MQAQAAQPPQLHELPRGIGHRFLQNHFEITDEEVREENRASIATGDSQWDDYQLQVVSRDCALFAREILSGPHERPYNGHFLLGPHHLEWSELVRKHKRICVLAPRDHGKSYFFDFAFPIWRAVMQPGGSGFIFSATQDQAVRILADIKQELESNPKLQYLVPDTSGGGKGKKWASTAIQLTNGHRIYARGFGTRVRGAHPCLVYDTELVTEHGAMAIGDLAGQTCRVLTGNGTWKEASFWKTGTKDVVTAQFGNAFTRDKQKLTATSDHQVKTVSSWKPLGDLDEGEVMALPESRHDLLFEFMGWVWNDGNYSHAQHQQRVYFSGQDGEALKRYQPFLTRKPHAGGCVYRVAKGAIQSAVTVTGNGYKKKCTAKQPPLLQTAEQKTAWVRGMFSANGTVVRSVRLKLSSLPVVQYVEGILHEFGVRTTPIVSSTNRLGFTGHTLHVHKKSIAQYLAVFGFVQSYKTAKAKKQVFPFWRLREIHYGRRPLKTEVLRRDVFDFQVLDPNFELERSAVTNGIIVHNCWIVVDDALNDETAYSEVVRKKQIEYFYTAVSNMVTPGGIIICVGTPFHQVDLYGDLENNEEYVFRRYSALIGPEELPLWPARYNKERLLSKRKEIGTLRFSREMMCIPVSDDASLFPLFLFQGSPTEVFTLTLGMPKEIYDRLGVTIYMGVDFAMSSSAAADYTVIWVMGLDKWGNRWIVDIKRGKGLPYQTQLSMINELGHKYDPALIFLESNQMQRIFGDELIRTTDLPIKQFVTGAQKNTLDKGVPSLRTLLENGKFRIPRGDKASIELTNIWIEEMRAFTWVDGVLKSVGTHDDLVMGLWVCDQAIRAGGFSFDFGDDVSSNGSLDKMLQDENSETVGTDALTVETGIEERLQMALGNPEIPKATGNLVGEDDEDRILGPMEPEPEVNQHASGNLVDDPGELTEEEIRRKLLGGAPSPSKMRSYW